MKYLKKFNDHAAYTEYEASGNMIKPNVSHCVQENEVHYNPYIHDYAEDYLTLVALESGTFTFTPQNNNLISYSIDNGATWTDGNSVEVNNGDKVLWKGRMTPKIYRGIGNFSSDCNFDVQGNAMSLLFGDSFKGSTSLYGKNYALYSLFGQNAKLINAKNLILPATTLADSCYQNMFQYCRSLITVPELPATTLAPNCYQNMFIICTSLTTAPELPATTLASLCYMQMFMGCTSLTTAPDLLVTTLTNRCYEGMFNGCTSLNYVKCLATDISANMCTSDWLNNAPATGTFVKAEGMDGWTRGGDGIPTGWTVQTA